MQYVSFNTSSWRIQGIYISFSRTRLYKIWFKQFLRSNSRLQKWSSLVLDIHVDLVMLSDLFISTLLQFFYVFIIFKSNADILAGQCMVILSYDNIAKFQARHFITKETLNQSYYMTEDGNYQISN